MTRIDLETLNSASVESFVEAVGDICENAPWIAEQVAARRPFATVAALHSAMMDVVREAPLADQLAFLRGHPELSGTAARAGAMTAASIAEQGSLGLDRLSDAEFDRFERANAACGAKF